MIYGPDIRVRIDALDAKINMSKTRDETEEYLRDIACLQKKCEHVHVKTIDEITVGSKIIPLDRKITRCVYCDRFLGLIG